MRLAHYTCIETLALILENKTIRFSRLDKLDDFYEVGIYNSSATKQFFVSCWSAPEIEVIPQWSMYGGNKRGVILIMDTDYVNLSAEGFPNELPLEEFADGSSARAFIIPNIITKNKPIKIEYLSNDDLKQKAQAIHQVNNQGGVTINGLLGNIKTDSWSFQNEYRLIVQVAQIKSFHHNLEDFNTERTYVDIALKDGVETDIEIILGPLSTESDRILVYALTKKYGVLKVSESKLNGILLR